MTLQQLEYVVAIDDYKHFIKAADSCGITQSTLSCMIHKLEEELDITIFDRSSHPIRPTLAGEQIIKQARIVLFHSNQLKEMSNNERGKVSGHIKFGITPTIAPYIMPKLFKAINDIPDLSMTAQELNKDELIRQLKIAKLDMAILTMSSEDNDLLEIPLYKEKLLAYISPNDPLQSMDKLRWDDIPKERLWALKHEICFQKDDIHDHYCNSEKISIYESGNVPTLLRIINENEGLTIIPEFHLPLLREMDLPNVRPIYPEKHRNVSLVVRGDYVRESLLNIIADTIKTIIPKEMIDERLLKYRIRL